jgi:hypothetical protein
LNYETREIESWVRVEKKHYKQKARNKVMGNLSFSSVFVVCDQKREDITVTGRASSLVVTM